jgi:signal peptidase II
MALAHALRPYARLALVAAAVLGLDQATKALVLERLPLHASLTVIPGLFDLTHVQNPGGAFGFLAHLGPRLRGVLFTAIAALAAGAIVVIYRQTPPGHRRMRSGLALVFGGAVGNLVDRLRFGAVVDFLDLYLGSVHWPAFNVADSAITAGVGLIAWQMLSGRKP